MTSQINRHLSANMTLKKRQIMLYNFIGGIAWGIGTVIGATVIVAIIGYILNQLGIFNFFASLPQLPITR